MRPDYRAVFESSPGHCLVLAADPPRFTIEAVSEAYLDGTRLRRDDLVGRGLFEVLGDPAAPAASAIRALRASLEGTPGRGTTFGITLPAIAAPVRPALRGVHVLVVDDDAGRRQPSSRRPSRR